MNVKIVLARRGTQDWQESADLVSKVFARSFGAEITPDPEEFIAYVAPGDDGRDAVQACIGVSFPENGPVFLERYLEGSLEETLSRETGQPIERHQIVQLGSVASVQPLAGAEIYRAFPLISTCLGRSYAVMTMTDRSARLAARIGLITHRLCEADGSRLEPEELATWGTFYDQKPAVRWGTLADHTQQLFTGFERYALDSVDIRLLSIKREELNRAA